MMMSHAVSASLRGLLPALLVLTAACASARMELPGELAATERLAVTGRQGWTATRAVRFGAYEAAAVDRSWTWGNDLQINEYERNRRRQGYAFTLRAGAEGAWRVECDARLLVRGVTVRGVTIEGENRSSLECEVKPEGVTSGSWRLALAEQGEKPLAGTLAGPGGSFAVAGTNQLQGTPLPAGQATGYRFERGGRVHGAVEVINDGAVWLHGATEVRELAVLAAAATALLLLEDLRATL
jgi:hypothetical protein